MHFKNLLLTAPFGNPSLCQKPELCFFCNRIQVELENTLEQEQEALVNRLWKRMDKLEAEKRSLQIRLDQPVSDPASPR